ERSGTDMKYPGKTRPFRGPRGEALPGSIAEIQHLRLGGLDQWVMIRGESLANPPLILLHGGPGFTETALFRYFNASLERSFTVVYWAAGESASYAFALAEAQRVGEHRAIEKLHAIGAPPHTAKRLWTERTCLSRLEHRLGARAMWKTGRAVLAAPESSIFDLPRT